MNNYKKIITILVIIIFIGGVIYISQNKKQEYPTGEVNQVENVTSTSTSSVASSSVTYTLADVSTHNSKISCWTAVNGNVYDVTSWIGQHPGGEKAILGLCGKDGTLAFSKQHGQAPQPNEALKSFLIGTLEK